MAFQIDDHLGSPVFAVASLLYVRAFRIVETQPAELPAGALRIGGDAPDGLVLVGAAPAARTVDLFDRELRLWVATTTSAGDGTYGFAGLSARTEGYDVCIRGVIASGERDAWIPGMHPG